MKLQAGFQFSQASLQDFSDCRRRFQLRYIKRIAWPAVTTEPVQESENAMQAGIQFHRILHQYLLGVPVQRINVMIQDEPLASWWQTFLEQVEAHAFPWLDQAVAIYPELMISAPLDPYRLVAKYDLVCISPDKNVTIVDWKTSRKVPKRQVLADRMQSRVYPYLLALAGQSLLEGEPPTPDQIEMVYWYPAHPRNPMKYSYSQIKFEEDQKLLRDLVTEIKKLGEADFPMTYQTQRCAYCVYRSLCDRGVSAGGAEGMDLEFDDDQTQALILDFEQIGEIEY